MCAQVHMHACLWTYFKYNDQLSRTFGIGKGHSTSTSYCLQPQMTPQAFRPYKNEQGLLKMKRENTLQWMVWK
jgi:hypothetical protein